MNVVIVLSCEYLWFPVISKGSNVPGQIEKHKKPQVLHPLENRLNRAKYFLVVFLRGLRGLSVSVKSTFLQYCELL